MRIATPNSNKNLVLALIAPFSCTTASVAAGSPQKMELAQDGCLPGIETCGNCASWMIPVGGSRTPTGNFFVIMKNGNITRTQVDSRLVVWDSRENSSTIWRR